MTPLDIFLIILAIILIWIFVGVRILRKIHPFPIPNFLTLIIDNPIRRKFLQNPDLIAKRMGATEGKTIVEIGPGKGSYTIGVAKRVSSNDRIYAVDISEDVLDRLRIRIKNEKFENIIPQKEEAYNFSFEDNSIDIIFAVTCLPEIPDHVKVLKECKRILKTDGIVSLCELFFDPDYPLRRTEKKWANEAGLTLSEEYGNWIAYQLNFKKTDS